jgi:hypothetical protein
MLGGALEAAAHDAAPLALVIFVLYLLILLLLAIGRTFREIWNSTQERLKP